MLVPVLVTISLAASVASCIGLILFGRVRAIALGGDLPKARRVRRAAVRLIAAGFAVLLVAMPAAIFVITGSLDVPPSRLAFAVAAIAMMFIAMVMGLLLADLQLQDVLRATPADAAAFGADESVTFELTPEHLWKSQIQWQWHSRTGRISLAIAVVCAIAAAVAMPFLTHSMHPEKPFLIDVVAAAVAIGITTLLFLVYGKKVLLSSLGSRPGVLCEHVIEIRPDGLRERTHVNDTLWKWEDVREVAESPEYVYLRVRAIGMFAVPKSAFGSEDRVRGFVNAVRGRLAARGGGVPIPA